eukprot:5214859-Alexandrium_andersonii.AAC.1
MDGDNTLEVAPELAEERVAAARREAERRLAAMDDDDDTQEVPPELLEERVAAVRLEAEQRLEAERLDREKGKHRKEKKKKDNILTRHDDLGTKAAGRSRGGTLREATQRIGSLLLDSVDEAITRASAEEEGTEPTEDLLDDETGTSRKARRKDGGSWRGLSTDPIVDC